MKSPTILKEIKSLKKYLTSPLILPKPGAAEDLYIYLAVLEVAISSIIIREELGARLPVFHSSKALLDATSRLPVFHSSKALLDATRNSKAKFGTNCCNPGAQVLPSDASSHPYDALFGPKKHATMKRQKDQKIVECLQSKEVPCETSHYIKAQKLK